MNILLVDDEMLAIEAICAKAPFEKYGITNVLTANSMQQAQSIIQDNRVDIVFCDIEMPSGSGLELMEWMNENYPGLVKIILSCHNEFEFAQQAVSMSCLQYILKPATPEVMDQALAKAVERVLRQDSEKKLKQMGELYVRNLTDTDEGNNRDIAEIVQKYITEHVQEELVVEKLAQMVYVSQNHLARCFKRKYGKTVLEYISDYRMDLAKKLLQDTNMTVTMVSAKVGYPNYAFFTKKFKKYSGYTPSQYRSLFTKKSGKSES